MNKWRQIPGIDEIISQPEISRLLAIYKRDLILDLVRKAVDQVREDLKAVDQEVGKDLLRRQILDRVQGLVNRATIGSLRKVINGTGVVLHTNLGRAPMGERALDYVKEAAMHYNNLEFDLASGERGSRYDHIEQLLLQLTGAEGALVVNNNAAAVMLGLNTMAKNREVIVSRGQLIEIGGAFRIPEVMKQSGARLIEVGTTNKTYSADYEEAINEQTGLLFSAHTSNYKIMGFAQEVSLEELVQLGQRNNIPVMQDLGSGILYDLGEWGLKEEPTVQKCVASGADIICFSGDKLLGGPQAGIILGRKKHIELMKKNQLTRALRVDKMTIAALEGTLLEYLELDPARRIPALKMLTAEAGELKSRAHSLARLLQDQLGEKNDFIASLQVVMVEDMVGGGAYPTYKLPGYGIEIGFSSLKLEEVSRRLRGQTPALLARNRDNKMFISVRTLLPGDDVILAALIKEVLY